MLVPRRPPRPSSSQAAAPEQGWRWGRPGGQAQDRSGALEAGRGRSGAGLVLGLAWSHPRVRGDAGKPAIEANPDTAYGAATMSNIGITPEA